MNISVGLPIYDGKLAFQLAGCLLTEVVLAEKLGHKITVRFLTSCTNLAMGRNQIVKDFLDSGDDRLVFVDADITFEPGDLIKIAHYPQDLVGGIYRFKLKDGLEAYPFAVMQGEGFEELRTNAHGLLRAKMVPTGFMSISPNVFAKFRETFPDRDYQSRDANIFCYFQIPYKDGYLYTEDGYFCEEWRDMGGEIFMDPELTLTHWDGNIPYKGHLGNWLKKLAGLPTATEQRKLADDEAQGISQPQTLTVGGVRIGPAIPLIPAVQI